MARSKPYVSDEVAIRLQRNYCCVHELVTVADLASDLLECRARLKAWEPTMLKLLPWSEHVKRGIERGERATGVTHDLLDTFTAIPPEHRPEPQWEPSKVDVAIVAEQVRKFSVGGSEGIAAQVLKALRDAGRLK